MARTPRSSDRRRPRTAVLVVVILVRVVVFWTSLGLATVVLLRAGGETAAAGSALGFVFAGAAAASRALTSQLRVDAGR